MIDFVKFFDDMSPCKATFIMHNYRKSIPQKHLHPKCHKLFSHYQTSKLKK